MRALAGLGRDISSLGRSYAQVKEREFREEEREQEKADILLRKQKANTTRLDIDAHLRKLEETHKDDPTQFLANATPYINTTFEGLEPEIRASIEVDVITKTPKIIDLA